MNVKQVKHLAYFKMAYPNSVFSLLKDGYIVSAVELAAMAQHILR